MKAGIRSSELWMLVSGTIATTLIGLGVISATDAEVIKTQAREVMEIVIAAIPVVVGLCYTICRTVLKARKDK